MGSPEKFLRTAEYSPRERLCEPVCNRQQFRVTEMTPMDSLRFAPLPRRFPGTHLMRRTCPAYDEKRLTEHGWKFERHPVSPDPQGDVPGTSCTRTSMVVPAASYPTRFTTGPRAWAGARRGPTGRARECKSSCTEGERSTMPGLPIKPVPSPRWDEHGGSRYPSWSFARLIRTGCEPTRLRRTFRRTRR